MYERGDYDSAYSLSFQARAIGEVQMEREPSKDNFYLVNLLSKIYYTHGALCNVTNARSEAYNEIGNDYMMQKDYDTAEKCYRTSIAKYNDLEEANKLQLALPSANLGLALWLKGDLDAASYVVEGALRDREELLGRDDRQSMK